MAGTRTGGHHDVVVVGGGIAGATLARSLAAEGCDVVVLEATEVFEDRVRGEGMHVWGVQEAARLGAEEVLMAAGAHIAPTWRQYTEGQAEPAVIPMGLIAEGVGGSLNLRHPDACQALLDAAAASGASMLRGVRDVTLSAGSPVGVSCRVGTAEHQLSAELVLGADGRSSTVCRQAGISLSRDPARNHISGLPRHRRGRAPALHRSRRIGGLPRGGGPAVVPVGRAGRRGAPRRLVRHLPQRRHLDGHALRRGCGPHRRRRGLQGPDHRRGPVHRHARRPPGP